MINNTSFLFENKSWFQNPGRAMGEKMTKTYATLTKPV